METRRNLWQETVDPEYFSKYYQNKLSTPFTCPDWGRTITSKSNLSKHRQTKKCMNSKCHWWNVELKPQSQKLQQQTKIQKLLKKMPPYILSRKMAEGQMLKKLPEECLLNISSFMLGTPQQMKFKNSKGLKQIQKNTNLIKKLYWTWMYQIWWRWWNIQGTNLWIFHQKQKLCFWRSNKYHQKTMS